MNSEIKVLLGVLIVGIVLISGFWIKENYFTSFSIEQCEQLKNQINEEIEKANFCQKDEDCAIVSFDCPFGCWDIVNKNEVEPIKKKVEKYREKCGRCLYKCSVGPEDVECKNGVCVPKPSKESIWTQKIREKYCGNYSKLLNEKIRKIEPKPAGRVFHEITLGEILKITKKDCNYVLDISPLEYIYIPYFERGVGLFHPSKLTYISECNESVALQKHDKIIAFSISYEVNDTLYVWSICLSKIENYENAVKISGEK